MNSFRCLGILLTLAWSVSAPLAGLAASPSTPTITLSVQSGPPGTTVTITGQGFPPGEIVALYIDQPGPYLDVPGPMADAQGGFSKGITWPGRNYDTQGKVNPTVTGPHEVCGDTGYPGSTQPLAVKACAQFNVEAGPSPTPPSAAPGASRPAASTPGLPLSVALVGFAILIALAVGTILWIRRSPKNPLG